MGSRKPKSQNLNISNLKVPSAGPPARREKQSPAKDGQAMGSRKPKSQNLNISNPEILCLYKR